MNTNTFMLKNQNTLLSYLNSTGSLLYVMENVHRVRNREHSAATGLKLRIESRLT